MKIRATAAIAALILTASLAACSSTESTSNPAPAASQTSSSSQAATKTGTFSGLNGKKVEGTVTVNDMSVVVSGYSSDEGPDLHIYLTNGTDEAAVAAGKQIAPISFSTASQTFSLEGIDPAMYTDVVIHCDKAQAVFGAATLG